MWKVFMHIGMFVIILDSAAKIAYGKGEPFNEWFVLIGGIAIEIAEIVVAINKKRKNT